MYTRYLTYNQYLIRITGNLHRNEAFTKKICTINATDIKLGSKRDLNWKGGSSGLKDSDESVSKVYTSAIQTKPPEEQNIQHIKC